MVEDAKSSAVRGREAWKGATSYGAKASGV